jgi:hypothetical protein
MALAEHVFSAIIVFGLVPSAIVTVDTGSRRTAGDAGKLEGIVDSKRKQSIVKTVANYLVKSGQKDAVLKSETEVLARIKRDDAVLAEAIKVGDRSAQNIAQPMLKDSQAETLAYLFLQGGWPTDLVHMNLTLFQSGQSTDGERTPFFVAAELIVEARTRREHAKRLSALKELGVVVEAMRLRVNGVTAIQKKQLENAVKKVLPSPQYPSQEEAGAA